MKTDGFSKYLKKLFSGRRVTSMSRQESSSVSFQVTENARNEEKERFGLEGAGILRKKIKALGRSQSFLLVC